MESAWFFLSPPKYLRPKKIAVLLAFSCHYVSSMAGVAAPSAIQTNDSHAATSSPIKSQEKSDSTKEQSTDNSAADTTFNPEFLMNSGSEKIDIGFFNKANAILPGKYFVDLIVNGDLIGEENIAFKPIAGDKNNVQPCFTRKLLADIKVKQEAMTADVKMRLEKSLDSPNSCLLLSQLIPGATTKYNSADQALKINIPQAEMQHFPRGYVSPELWDDGVPALIAQYNANFYQTKGSDGLSNQSGYLGLHGGVNFNAWRLRYAGNLSYTKTSDSSKTSYSSTESYVQRPLRSLKSQLVLGNVHSDGSIFDSFDFRGVAVSTDDRMLPPSRRGYAPVIRGMANSNAHVSIRQNGSLLYESTVSAGPFEINDLYPSGYGGDLLVTVTEADGSVHSSSMPFSAAPTSLREGVFRYSLLAGQYNDESLLKDKPMVVQGVIQHGFSNLFTGYTGAVASKKYWSAIAGVAINSDYGAFGGDITYSSTQTKQYGRLFGHSLRFSYSKFISETNTNFDISAYRFSSQNFLGLRDAVQIQDQDHLSGLSDDLSSYKQRNRFQAMINQSFGRYGSLYFNGTAQNYWKRKKTNYQFQLGFNCAFKGFSLGFSASREFAADTQKPWQNRFMLMLNMPFGHENGDFLSSTSANYNSSIKALNVSQGFSGAFGENKQVNYGVNLGYNDAGVYSDSGSRKVTNVQANISDVTQLSSISASIGQSKSYVQGSVSASGSIIAYSEGVAFSSSSLGDSVAVIEAKDAEGAKIANNDELKINSWGLGIMPSLTPFSRNEIGINLRGLPIDVELASTSANVVPTSGAVVAVQFKAKNTGRSAIIQAVMPDGTAVPFGAGILDEHGSRVGAVAQGGLLVISGMKNDIGVLSVKWGDGANKSCKLKYHLPAKEHKKSGYNISEQAVCDFPVIKAQRN